MRNGTTYVYTAATTICVLALLALIALANANDERLTESMHKAVVACVQAGGNPVECRAATK